MTKQELESQIEDQKNRILDAECNGEDTEYLEEDLASLEEKLDMEY